MPGFEQHREAVTPVLRGRNSGALRNSWNFEGWWQLKREDRGRLAKIAKKTKPETIMVILTVATCFDGAPCRCCRSINSIVITHHLKGDSGVYSVAGFYTYERQGRRCKRLFRHDDSPMRVRPSLEVACGRTLPWRPSPSGCTPPVMFPQHRTILQQGEACMRLSCEPT